MLQRNIDALMNAVILQSADHFESGAIADVSQTRIAMAAEVALQNPPVFGAIENRAPGFEFMDARRSFLRVQLRHAAIVQILPAAHGVGEMHPPVVAVVHVAHRRGHAAFGHHGVRLAQQRFGDDASLRPAAEASIAARNPAPPAPITSTSYSCIGYSAMLKNSPIVPNAHRAQSRMYTSAKPTQEHAEPGPLHVAAVQAGHAIVGLLAHRRPRHYVFDPAHQVAEGVATEGIAAEQNRIQDHDQRSDADPEVLHAVRAREPQRPVARQTAG